MISAFENRTSAFELPSSPDDGRKFTELYNVQHLQRSQREAVRHRREARRVDARERVDQSAQLDRVTRVCISTIQRLYSMLRFLIFWDRNTDAARRNQRDQDRQRLVRVERRMVTALSNSSLRLVPC